MTQPVKHSNSWLTIAVLVLSLVIHFLFVTFYSLGQTVAGYAIPTDDFFVVTSVEIEDTPYGQDPQMRVDRTIVQAFPGVWVVRIATASGEWVCGNNGSTPYHPDATLPENIGLFDFWLFIDKEMPNKYCRQGFYPLPEGCYIVDTTWEIQDERAKPPRLVTNRSNEFCVTSEVTTEG